jgi:alpha-ketoglutarate-dependent taurine dioxygenase
MNSITQTCDNYPKQAFDSELTSDSFSISVKSSSEIISSTSPILDLLNQYGVVVVQFEEEEAAREQLLCFKKIFGNTMNHDRSDEYGIAEVAVIDETSPYPGLSSRAYTFHTDGTYDEHPPSIVALRCATPAQVGGVTQLASGKKLYEKLLSTDKAALEALYSNDALLISRAGKTFSGAVFRNIENRIAIRYRTDEAAHYSENADVQRGMGLIQDYLSDEKNIVSFSLKSRQVLITDNLSVLHARTAFGSSDARQMHRLYFTGVPQEETGPCLGFISEK